MLFRDVSTTNYQSYKLKVPDKIYQLGKNIAGMMPEMYVFGPVTGFGFFLSKDKPTDRISGTILVEFRDPKSILDWEVIN